MSWSDEELRSYIGHALNGAMVATHYRDQLLDVLRKMRAEHDLAQTRYESERVENRVLRHQLDAQRQEVMGLRNQVEELRRELATHQAMQAVRLDDMQDVLSWAFEGVSERSSNPAEDVGAVYRVRAVFERLHNANAKGLDKAPGSATMGVSGNTTPDQRL